MPPRIPQHYLNSHLKFLYATAGTKPGSMKPVGSTGLAVVSVNPYGCNAPAVPLQSWNIDLTQNYVLRGIALNALTIPSQGELQAPMLQPQLEIPQSLP